MPSLPEPSGACSSLDSQSAACRGAAARWRYAILRATCCPVITVAMRGLYSLIFLLLLPVVLLRLWWRGRANPGYRLRWRERFARLPVLKTGGIWVHAVSVGETLAAVP